MLRSILNIFQKQSTNLETTLQSRMKTIQTTHAEWFQKRQESHPGDSMNDINSHWKIDRYGPGYALKFVDGSDLPDEIKAACLKAFQKVYS